MADLRRAVKTAGRRGVLWYGMATAQWRPRPDFIVIGAKRGGTTSLYRYLQEHPNVLPMFPSAKHVPLMGGDQKGTHYLDALHGRGARWWRGHFPTTAARRLAERRLGGPVQVGEGCPYHLFHPHSPSRAAFEAPDAKLLLLLRDPVLRTHSHWKEQRRNGTEVLDFPAAVEAEPTRLAGEWERLVADPRYVSAAHEHQGYVAQSDYLGAVERWLAAVDPSRLLIRAAEDLYARPQKTFDEVTAFLGLPSHRLERTDPWNAAEAAPIDAGLEAELRGRFAPGVAGLEALLGRSLPWPR